MSRFVLRLYATSRGTHHRQHIGVFCWLVPVCTVNLIVLGVLRCRRDSRSLSRSRSRSHSRSGSRSRSRSRRCAAPAPLDGPLFAWLFLLSCFMLVESLEKMLLFLYMSCVCSMLSGLATTKPPVISNAFVQKQLVLADILVQTQHCMKRLVL